MTVAELSTKLQQLEADGHGDALFVIPDFSTRVASPTGEPESGGFIRDGEYAPESLYVQSSGVGYDFRNRVVCE